MLTKNDLKVLVYELERDDLTRESITLDRVYGIYRERWAIRAHLSEALGKTPDEGGYFLFSIEPMPSSRDEKYFQEYRWRTLDDALRFWNENRPRIVATVQEKRAWYERNRDADETRT